VPYHQRVRIFQIRPGVQTKAVFQECCAQTQVHQMKARELAAVLMLAWVEAGEPPVYSWVAGID